MLVYQLELFSAEIYYHFGYLDTIVSQVMSLCFYHNDGMLLNILGVRSTSSFSYMDIVLSSVITLFIGWLLHTRILSCGGYAFFQVHKNLK